MTVYIVSDPWSKEPYAVFSSEEKAVDWLANKAAQEWGWTHGEVVSASIEPWPVDPV